MFCGECGTQNPDTNQFCKNCGKPLKKKAAAIPGPQAQAAALVQPAPDPQPAVQAQPVYYNPLAGTQPQVPEGIAVIAPAVAEKPKRTWLAIVSLIPAIFSWVLYPVLLGFVALVFGIVSIYLWRKQGTRFPLSGIIAIIIGLLAIVLNIFWLDIFPPPQVLPPIE